VTTATATHEPSRACYLRGCQHNECEQANYRYMKRLRLEHARGQRRRTDATQTRAHVERLIAAGWNQAQISRAANLAHRTIGAVVAGSPTVANTTALAILSIHIGPPPQDARDVDATGTTRRLQALVTIGWPIAQLAHRFGIYPTALGNITRGELQHVRATTAETIALHYRQLSRTPGPSQRARNDARKKGWHSPLAWDGAAIDDPNAQPDTHGQDDADDSRRRKVPADPARVARLTAQGLSAGQIASHIGCHKRSVVRARRRAEMQVAA
jgi:DNA-binding CsgD family transcriptional regulator